MNSAYVKGRVNLVTAMRRNYTGSKFITRPHVMQLTDLGEAKIRSFLRQNFFYRNTH